MEEMIVKQAGVLSCDFDAIKKHLEAELSKYSGMEFNESTKQEAKNAVAELRKEKKLYTDRVKEVKNEYMKPYNEFYAKACEVIELFESPIFTINQQVETFEAKRKEEKRAHISNLYLDMVPEEDMQAIIPLARIYDAKWENTTTTDKAIKEAILNYKVSAKQAIDTLVGMESEKVPDAIEHYKRTYDLAGAMQIITRYEQQKREVLERERERVKREEEERIRREERAKLEAERKNEEALVAVAKEAQQEVIEALTPAVTLEEAKSFTYMIKLTSDAKEKLELYMNSVGIEFEEFPAF